MRSSRVLVVDDDPGISEFVEALLTDEGYHVASAPHGAAALDLLSRYRPDIILLDMRMPVMDGEEFLRRYHQMPGPYARVVVMSAAQDTERIAGRVAAATVIAKPFQVDELLDLLVRHGAVAHAPKQT